VTRGKAKKTLAAAGTEERRPRTRSVEAARSAGARPQPPMAQRKADDGVVLTPEQQRSRRARSIGIALVLGALAVLFYAVTIAKLGPNVLVRPL